MPHYTSEYKTQNTKPPLWKFWLHESRHRKDASWKKSQNPFNISTDDGLGTRKKIYIAIILFSFIGICYTLLFNEFFHVQKVEIQGNDRITKQELIDTVIGITRYNKLLFLPGESYVLVNTNEIRDILMKKYPLNSITVKKTFPNLLTIELTEKISTVIYDNGYQYAYIGTDGKIIELLEKVGEDEWEIQYQMATTTNEQGNVVEEKREVLRIHEPSATLLNTKYGNYPIIYHEGQGTEIHINDTLFNDDTILKVIEIYHAVNTFPDLQYKYVHIENDSKDLLLYTKNGLIIRFTGRNDIKQQLEYLNIFFANNKTAKEYIDLRYDGTIYWK
ncbi:MAG: FtsQ-type POTRA domain-containing protein [Candidatus Magasanikbacteria bacterium]